MKHSGGSVQKTMSAKIIPFPTKGFKKPQHKWDQVCRWCRGSGFTPGLHGPEACSCGLSSLKEEPDDDSWPALIRDCLLDAFGEDVWREIRTSREAQLKAYMIVDDILRYVNPEMDKVDRFKLVYEAIPLKDGEARNLARHILDEQRCKL
jgi:hypothetical protein